MTIKLGIFGNPVDHSLSPIIHQSFAKSVNLDIEYQKIKVDESFDKIAKEYFSKDLIGANVTVPCKKEAFDFCTVKTKRAIRANAVNTIIKENDTLIGDNTDGTGFIMDLQRLKVELKDKRVLLIGSGGASSGVLLPLLDTDIKSLCITNRSFDKLENMIESLKSRVIKEDRDLILNKVCQVPISKLDNNFDIIINASSSSLYNSLPNIDDDIYKNANVAYDLMYSKDGSTIFTRHLQQLGIPYVFDGIGMLIMQAWESFYMWTQKRADVDNTIIELRKMLGT